jgi:hypothetical protein
MVLVTASRIPFHADSGRIKPVNINVNETSTISTRGYTRSWSWRTNDTNTSGHALHARDPTCCNQNIKRSIDSIFTFLPCSFHHLGVCRRVSIRVDKVMNKCQQIFFTVLHYPFQPANHNATINTSITVPPPSVSWHAANVLRLRQPLSAAPAWP